MPADSSLARMNGSIGCFGHDVSFTAGAGRGFGGWNDQCFFASSRSLLDGAGRAAAAFRGSADPSAIHFSKSATTDSGSLPGGGILVSPPYFIAAKRVPSAGLPGTTAGPLS